MDGLLFNRVSDTLLEPANQQSFKDFVRRVNHRARQEEEAEPSPRRTMHPWPQRRSRLRAPLPQEGANQAVAL